MKQLKQVNRPKRVSSEGLPRVEGNKGTLAKYRRGKKKNFLIIAYFMEQGNKLVRKHDAQILKGKQIKKTCANMGT